MRLGPKRGASRGARHAKNPVQIYAKTGHVAKFFVKIIPFAVVLVSDVSE